MIEELWKGGIKLLEVKGNDETIVKWDYEFDLEELLPILRRLKHEYGENIVASLIYAQIGLLERLKLDLLSLLEDVGVG